MSAPPTVRDPRAREAQGQPAGIVSRGLANLVDLGVAWVITFLVLGAWSVVAFLAFGDPLRFPRPDVSLTLGLFWFVLVLYLADGWGSDGKTIGKRVMGLRVEGDGRTIRPRRWLVRAIIAVAAWPVMLGWCALSPRRRGLHDRLLGTRVVYDWSRT